MVQWDTVVCVLEVTDALQWYSGTLLSVCLRSLMPPIQHLVKWDAVACVLAVTDAATTTFGAMSHCCLSPWCC